MFRNLEAEQARMRETNQDVADLLRISRVAYESKKKTGKFTAIQCTALCEHYGVKFEYLFEPSDSKAS